MLDIPLSFPFTRTAPASLSCLDAHLRRRRPIQPKRPRTSIRRRWWWWRRTIQVVEVVTHGQHSASLEKIQLWMRSRTRGLTPYHHFDARLRQRRRQRRAYFHPSAVALHQIFCLNPGSLPGSKQVVAMQECLGLSGRDSQRQRKQFIIWHISSDSTSRSQFISNHLQFFV